MTDADSKNGAPPEPSQEQVEQLQTQLAQQIVQQTLQLLALMGVHVAQDDIPQLMQAGLAVLLGQQQLLTEILPTLKGPAAAQNPMLGAQISKGPTTTIALPGQPPNQPFAFAGPKQLTQASSAGEIAATLATLALLTQPSLRLAALVLGAEVTFVQGSNAPRLPWKGMAR